MKLVFRGGEQAGCSDQADIFFLVLCAHIEGCPEIGLVVPGGIFAQLAFDADHPDRIDAALLFGNHGASLQSCHHIYIVHKPQNRNFRKCKPATEKTSPARTI
jgi:hypothetical protein